LPRDLAASWRINDTKNKTRKIKNRTFAIPIAAPAMPVKPNTPATSATIKKMSVHPNIKFLSQLCLLTARNLLCRIHANEVFSAGSRRFKISWLADEKYVQNAKRPLCSIANRNFITVSIQNFPEGVK
jgi:hypothetical protein